MVVTNFNNIIYSFQTYGVMEFLLPFLLVFTIMFAVTKKIHLFSDSGDKKFSIIISLVIALIFVGSSVLGTYPLGYDPVRVLNSALPSVALLAVGIVMMLLLLGVFGFGKDIGLMKIIAAISVGFMIYIFGASLNFWRGPYSVWNWWTPQLTELLIIILVFGGIVAFITGDEKKNSENFPTKAGNALEYLFGKNPPQTPPRT